MSRKVMILHGDVDALGTLASALRARGLVVSIASEVFDAVEQAYQKKPHVLLAAKELDREGDLSAALAAVPSLTELPLYYLIDPASKKPLGPRDVKRTDVDRIASLILEVALRETVSDAHNELRGNVQQMPLVDLLQLLTMNQRSGTLSVTAPGGGGEVRLADGQIVDAIYRRVEGEKALFRLLAVQAGQFAFVPGEPAPRKIQTTTNALLMEAMRQIDELRQLRRELAPASEVFLANELFTIPAVSGAPPPTSIPGEEAAQRVERETLAALQVPRGIDELCDEVAASDLEVATALSKLLSSGRVHAMPLSSLTAPFAPEGQLSILRALVARLTPKGFLPPPRLVIAASLRRMLGLAHAVRYIEGVVANSDVPPRAALPRPFGTLRLGEGVELSLVGLPVDDTFAPVWALTLPGAAAVVRIDGAGGPAFEQCCEAVEVQLLEAEQLVTELDVAMPSQVAALVRAAIETAAGV